MIKKKMNSKNLKYLIERRYKGFIFWILIGLSFFLILKTTDDPILPIFQGTFLESLFQQFDVSNVIISDISIGFFVSAIFYIVVVFLPDRQKKKDMEPFLRSKCENVIFLTYAFFNEIIPKSGLDYKYQTLTKEQLLEICKRVNPKGYKRLFSDGYNNISEQNLGYSLHNTWSKIQKDIDDTFRFLPFMDTGIIKKMNSIRNNFIQYMIRDLLIIDKLTNTDLEAWSETFYGLYIDSKDFRDYYVQYSKSKFENDPWKEFTASNTTQTTCS